MHSAVLRTCAAFVLLCFAAIFLPAQNSAEKTSQNDDPSQDHVGLAVEEQPRGQLRIEPIATVDENELTPIQTSCVSFQQASEDFSAKYLQPGKNIPCSAAVPSPERARSASRIAARPQGAVTGSLMIYSGSQKIRGQVRALATNAQLPRRLPRTGNCRAARQCARARPRNLQPPRPARSYSVQGPG